MRKILLSFLAIFVLVNQSLAETTNYAAGRPSLKREQIAFSNQLTNRNYDLNLNLPSPLKNNSATNLFPVDIHLNSRGEVYLPSIPNFSDGFAGRMVGRGTQDEYVVFTLNPELQKYVEQQVKNTRASHVAIVVMEPQSGKILALADKSISLKRAVQHAGYPAASLFKVVTSTAALEKSNLKPSSNIKFRGGNYTLNKYNYAPNSKSDRRSMTLSEALGKSCNPVFARVALNHLSAKTLSDYANSFGFNSDLGFDSPGPESSAFVSTNSYELSRTAAGFGPVYISPIHAASFMSSVANGGMLPRPFLVDRIISKRGNLLYKSQPVAVRRVMDDGTSKTLLNMMESTTTSGTSKYAFYRGKTPVLSGIRVAGKTGTLRGQNPKGLNKWFVGSAPIEKPEITVSVLVNNPQNSAARASLVGRLVLQHYFKS